MRNSSLFRKANSGDILSHPTKLVDQKIVRPLILGDGAYPLCDWLVKPFYQDHRLDPVETKFNRSLSSTRVVVEQAFGLLKARWRCLLKRLDNKVENVSKIIITCCVLHNICQKMKMFFQMKLLSKM